MQELISAGAQFSVYAINSVGEAKMIKQCRYTFFESTLSLDPGRGTEHRNDIERNLVHPFSGDDPEAATGVF